MLRFGVWESGMVHRSKGGIFICAAQITRYPPPPKNLKILNYPLLVSPHTHAPPSRARLLPSSPPHPPPPAPSSPLLPSPSPPPFPPPTSPLWHRSLLPHLPIPSVSSSPHLPASLAPPPSPSSPRHRPSSASSASFFIFIRPNRLVWSCLDRRKALCSIKQDRTEVLCLVLFDRTVPEKERRGLKRADVPGWEGDGAEKETWKAVMGRKGDGGGAEEGGWGGGDEMRTVCVCVWREKGEDSLKFCFLKKMGGDGGGVLSNLSDANRNSHQRVMTDSGLTQLIDNDKVDIVPSEASIPLMFAMQFSA